VEEEKVKFSVFLTPTLDESEISVVSCLKIWNSFSLQCLFYIFVVCC